MKLPWVQADFNEVFDGNLLVAIVEEEAEPPIVSGSEVVLYDGEGTICWAIVVERRGNAIKCKLDRSNQGPFTPSNVNSGVVDSGGYAFQAELSPPARLPS